MLLGSFFAFHCLPAMASLPLRPHHSPCHLTIEMTTCSPRPHTLGPVLCLFNWPASRKPLDIGLLFLFVLFFLRLLDTGPNQVCFPPCSDKTGHTFIEKDGLGDIARLVQSTLRYLTVFGYCGTLLEALV